MKKEQSITDKTDLKVFILCLLNEFQHPMNYTAIVDTALDCGCEAGLDFTDCFMELLDEGHILSDVIDSDTYYVISESGTLVARELRSSLAEQILEKANISATRHLELQKMGICASVTILPNKGESKLVQIKIAKDENCDLMNVSLYVANDEEARKIKLHVESSKAENIYQAIMAVTTGTMDYLL